MKRSRWGHYPPILFAGLLFLPVSLMAEEGLSHVRVVRLSFLSGTVAVQRPGSEVRRGVAFPLYSFGMITVSMTWITPFDASMSAFTTLALSTLTPSVASIDT